MRRVYAPFLLKREVKQLVIAAFGGLFIAAIVGIQHITMGLGKYDEKNFDSWVGTDDDSQQTRDWRYLPIPTLSGTLTPSMRTSMSVLPSTLSRRMST
jgi:hypothetical protein